MIEHQIDVASATDETLSLVESLAEAWGAEWSSDSWGGRLTLPVRAGLRRGWMEGKVAVQAADGGSTIRYEVEEQHWAVHWQAVVILVFGAFGGMIALAWPFFPRLLALAPLGIILTLSAWFLITSRLRSSGPEEFLAAIAAAARRE